MSWDEAPTDDEPLGRPFLTGAGAGRGAPPPPGAWPPSSPPAPFRPPQGPSPGFGAGPSGGEPQRYEDQGGEVRPYLLTGGRTSARGAAVAMETVVLATGARSTRGPDAAGLERARILRLAERPCSAAEVAARLHLPLQVALVLVADLVAEGLLDATAVELSQADDVLFLERLIAGVAAL